MKIIEPNVQEVTDFEGVDNFYKAVARAARICYASDKTTDDKALVASLIERKHFSPFEHAILYIKQKEIEHITSIDIKYKPLIVRPILKFIFRHKYTSYKYHGRVATNGRVVIESILRTAKTTKGAINLLDLLLEFLKDYEAEKSCPTFKFKSFIVDTSIGCTREMNRHHDNFYICEQSSRFCNFSKDKFGNEVAFNKPYWYDEIDSAMQGDWEARMQEIESMYMGCVKRNYPLDIARGILPLDTHTRAIYTATIEEWNHIIDLRLKGTTGKPHGDIKIITEKINNLIRKENGAGNKE